jgi:hypothetical protein
MLRDQEEMCWKFCKTLRSADAAAPRTVQFLLLPRKQGKNRIQPGMNTDATR